DERADVAERERDSEFARGETEVAIVEGVERVDREAHAAEEVRGRGRRGNRPQRRVAKHEPQALPDVGHDRRPFLAGLVGGVEDRRLGLPDEEDEERREDEWKRNTL